MKAYYGKQELKDQVLQELQAHYDADNFVKGQYWENGKGCAVGCLLKSGNHIEYEEKFGIPISLAMLEDEIFEGLPNDKAKEWPIKFMSSFEIGNDYSNVVWEFLRWMLIDYLLPQVKGKGKVFDDVREALKESAKVLEVGNQNADDADVSANAAAYAAAVNAAYAAAAAAAAAAYAARSAAYAAVNAAYAADYAAYAADYADYAAADYAAAAAAARSAANVGNRPDAAYEKFADKLIEIIKAV